MDWIGETFTSDAGWDHLETLVDIGDRMAGTDGELRAARATRDALAEYARNVRMEDFEIQGWKRGTAAVRAADTDHECIALPRSPSGEVTGEFVDLGHGLPEEFEDVDLSGRVVMVASDVPSWYDRTVHRREKYYHAVEAGAEAFVFRNHVEGCLAPTGSVGTEARPVGEIPAVGVSKEVGSRLARRFDAETLRATERASGRSLRGGEDVTVRVDAATFDATSQNVHAELGPDTAERVLVTSHVDAHDVSEGAVDNGAGTAMVVELARALSVREDELETRVEFVVFGAEEVGLLGSEYAAAEMDTDAVAAVLNCDGVVQGRDLAFSTHGFDMLARAARDVFDQFDHPVHLDPKMGPHSDHWPFVAKGVPGYHVYAETDASGRGWGHTRADTLDKLEKRDLREGAILLTDLAVELASEERKLPHRSTEEIAADLEAQALAAGMRVTGDWPYED